MTMQTLFSIPPGLPDGFSYVPDFLTEAEEDELTSLVKSFPLKNMMFQGFEAKRKVASFGYDYHFDSRSLSKGHAIPEIFQPLMAKVAAILNIPTAHFTELLLTEYAPGTVINWHRDAPPFDQIAGISLGADCRFRLRPYGKTGQTRRAIKSFTVERCSLYLIKGEARQDWEHSIAPVKELRYSITLRTLRGNGLHQGIYP